MRLEKNEFTQVPGTNLVRLDEIATMPVDDFEQVIVDGVADGKRVVSMFGAGQGTEDKIAVYAVLADDRRSRLCVGRTEMADGAYPSLTPRCQQVHLFERELAEQFGIVPEGHPWFKPVRYQHSWTGRDAWGRSATETILPGVGDFYRVEGEQVHEVAVGPIHAGIIEPGHFRFQCHGEQVFHLEIALGYQHRGIERALSGGPDSRSLHYAETLAGDSTIAHASAYTQVVESLTGRKKNAPAQVISAIMLELERLANHVGDLGALSGDVGYLPTASFCGRIRGDFLNMTALLCGNRFGRGIVLPGGLGFDMDAARQKELLRRLAVSEKETTIAIDLLWETQSVMARFEGTGKLPKAVAQELGMVGPAARASGLSRDARYYQPSGIYRLAQIPVSTYDTGDVFARAYVRWMEVQRSITFIREQVQSLPAGSPVVTGVPGQLAADSLAVSLVEGWRGELCHVALTDANGRFSRYKVVDPSFHNWFGLAYAMRDQEISDFPVCNKSFNLSYCGHDL
ncbi:MAG TPA: NADH-quinone oxidoreductase subunit C [bacterium]|nr:NADH-quinone oxidoreductase subunit C [bacterium]